MDTAMVSSSSVELLRDLVAEVAAQRASLDELHAAVQLALAMLDELVSIARVPSKPQ